MSNIIAEVVEAVPFDKIDDQDQVYTLKKEQVLTWACRFEVADCVSRSQEAFAAYQQNGVRSEFVSNLKIMLCLKQT